MVFPLFYFSTILTANGQNLKLKIIGNSEYENTVIDSLDYNREFENIKTLNQEIASVQKQLQIKGYIENKLLYSKKENDSLYVAKFDLKKQFYTIYIYYNKNNLDKSFLDSFLDEVEDSFFKVPIIELENSLNYVNDYLISKGLPFNSLKLTALEKRDDESIRANLIIASNKIRTINSITLKGYEKFPKSFLKHYAKIKESDILDLKELQKKSQLINQLPFANEFRTPEILFTKDSSSVFLYLEKGKANAFDGFLGFGTNENNNKLEFYGYLDLKLLNNLNYGETFKVKYRSDGNDQRTFNANLNLPYLLGSPIGTELSLNIFKQDSTFTNTQQTLDIFYNINQKQKIIAGISSRQSNDITTNLTETVQDYNATFYSLGYHYTSKRNNDPLFPINFSFQSKLGFGSRTVNSLKEEQSTFSIYSDKIFNLNKNNSIYLKLISEGLISDQYLTNELLRLGGINSLRGFDENSIYASLYATLNSEYRFRLSSSLYVYSIIDAAYIENQLIDLEDKLYGFGIGFGLVTKSGLLKFNYGVGKTGKEKIDFSNSKIQLSLSTSF